MNKEQISTAVVSVVRAHMEPDVELSDESGDVRLADLGIDSMRLISMILMLEDKIGLDFEHVVGLQPPRTVDDLISVAVRGCAVKL